MFARRCAAALICLSCGGAEGIGLSIGTSSAALAEDVQSLQLKLFAERRACELIRASGPDRRGLFEQTLTTGRSAELNDLVPGDYTVVVWAFDAENLTIGFGCQPTTIEPNRQTQVTVNLTEL